MVLCHGRAWWVIGSDAWFSVGLVNLGVLCDFELIFLGLFGFRG